MKTSKAIITATISGALALGALTMAPVASADEKCYGIVKAGQNECQSATGSCAGSATEDGMPSAFIVLPDGICEKIVGGSLEKG